MKKNGRKWWWGVLISILPLMVACSVEDANADFSTAIQADEMTMPTSGVYEGEWAVNKQVVDTARLVVNDGVMEVRLPESYLLTYFIPADYEGMSDPNKTNNDARYVPKNTPSKIMVSAQGYSEMSEYMSFSSAMYQANSLQRYYNTCSFDATIEGAPCHISLLSKENATAVLQKTTGQWTLGISIDGFLVKNQTTGEQTMKELSVRTTIYYITKRRIG